MSDTGKPLLELRGVGKTYRFKRHSMFQPPRTLAAAEAIDLTLLEGKTLGIVGESGSGKSTVGKMILKLERPSSGVIRFEGADVFGQSRSDEVRYRSLVQVVLQDPYGALSPRMKIEGIVTEPLMAQGVGREDARERAGKMLDMVGLDRAVMERYPHQFSGGQRQRIAIARALSVDPRMVVLDEAVSALDVSVRAQILQLLKSMQARLGNSYVFIGHDLATVRFMSDDVAVMYFGRVVEVGPAAKVLGAPSHPYTRHLVEIARGDKPLEARRQPTELPDPFKLPSGCRYRSRCPMAAAICEQQEPALAPAGQGHMAACHFADFSRTGPAQTAGLASV
jgi:oligopeptide/dipeptide ABC transporter ATP-binding protein